MFYKKMKKKERNYKKEICMKVQEWIKKKKKQNEDKKNKKMWGASALADS